MDSATVTVASDMLSFTYNEQCIPIAKFKYFVAALFQDTLDVLFDDLLFCSSDLILPLCPLHNLKDEVEDDPNSLKSGYSFLTEPDNASILQPGFTNVIANLEEIPNGGDLLISRTADCSLTDFARGNFKIAKSLTFPVAAMYEAAANRFLELLLVTILVTSGTPLVGEDLLQVLLVNVGSALRGVWIMKGVVTVVTRNRHPPNSMRMCTFTHDQVGRMIVLYIADVLPIRRGLPTATPEFKENKFLFAEGDKHWPKERFDKVMKRETRKRLAVEMDVAGFLEMFKFVMPGMYDADG